MALDLVKDTDAVTELVDEVPAAFGSDVPLQFTAITYAGNTPTVEAGITFQLLVKASKADTDANALIDATNAAMTITESPLVVGFDVDTQIAGFAAKTTFFGELWVVDTTFGTFLVKEFQLKLSDPIKSTFP